MNQLKRLRVQANLSIEQLSKEANIACNTISQLERELNNAQPRTIQRLANFFKVDYEDLMFLETQTPTPTQLRQASSEGHAA